MHSGDETALREIYPAIVRLMRYLQSHCRPDGLFEQRYATSKNAISAQLGDVSHRLYMNVLLWKCHRDAAEIAGALGAAEREAWRRTADRLAATIRRELLYDGA